VLFSLLSQFFSLSLSSISPLLTLCTVSVLFFLSLLLEYHSIFISLLTKLSSRSTLSHILSAC
jgi:hypothetical protein